MDGRVKPGHDGSFLSSRRNNDALSLDVRAVVRIVRIVAHPIGKVRPHTVPTPPLLALLTACPARCYELNDKGQVEIAADGCVECGTCRIIGEPSGDIEWNYPRGGYGVLFKFG